MEKEEKEKRKQEKEAERRIRKERAKFYLIHMFALQKGSRSKLTVICRKTA
jgi:hypothetical protein